MSPPLLSSPWETERERETERDKGKREKGHRPPSDLAKDLRREKFLIKAELIN